MNRLTIPMGNGNALAIGPEDPAVPLALLRRDLPRWATMWNEAAAAPREPGEEVWPEFGGGMSIQLLLDRHDRLCRALLMPELSKVLRGEVLVDRERYFATLARIVRGEVDSEGGQHD